MVGIPSALNRQSIFSKVPRRASSRTRCSFLKFGKIGFGQPVADIATMEDKAFQDSCAKILHLLGSAVIRQISGKVLMFLSGEISNISG
jgi:hypothetical protein